MENLSEISASNQRDIGKKKRISSSIYPQRVPKMTTKPSRKRITKR